MTDVVGDAPRWAALPWGRLILAGQLLVFALPAVITWTSALDGSMYLPLLTLTATFLAGLTLLVVSRWRAVGVRAVGIRVVGATMLAAGLAMTLTVALFVAYAALHPGWGLLEG